MTNSIPEIRDTDMLFVIGSNTTEAHPIIAMEMKRAVSRGAKLVVADPRKIWLTGIAQTHLQLNPGTDVWLLNAMAHVIIEEDLADRKFIEKHTKNFAALAKHLKAYTPEGAEEITGVAAEEIRSVARLYATTPKAGIYYTLGITEHTHGTDNVYALANLVLMTGHLGVKSAGLNPLRGQNNVQGANDAGASPIFYPGYQRVTEPESQKKFEAAWGTDLSPHPGQNLNEMMKNMGGAGLRAFYIMGEDIVLSEPNTSKIEAGLNECEFIVVQDIFLNETCRFADVILPATCFAEKDGVFTNSDRRVQRVRKAVNPPGEARADWRIICDIARQVGYPMPNYSSPGEIYDEMASLSPKFSGISYARLEQEGSLQWPCPNKDHPGTTFLHENGPAIGQAEFMAVDYRPSAEQADVEFPLVLSTGRTLYHYNSATQTRRESGSHQKDPENFVEVHRHEARKLSLTHGDKVKVSSRRGAIECRVRISKRVKPGCVWMPLHFSESLTNRLTNDAGDIVTGTGEYKVCAVRIDPLDASPSV